MADQHEAENAAALLKPSNLHPSSIVIATIAIYTYTENIKGGNFPWEITGITWKL